MWWTRVRSIAGLKGWIHTEHYNDNTELLTSLQREHITSKAPMEQSEPPIATSHVARPKGNLTSGLPWPSRGTVVGGISHRPPLRQNNGCKTEFNRLPMCNLHMTIVLDPNAAHPLTTVSREHPRVSYRHTRVSSG